MKSFIEYLAESEQHQYRPRVGDTVGFEINEELLIEARVTGLLTEGIEIELDQYATNILESLELAKLEEAETDDEDYKRGGSDAWYHRKRKEGQPDKYYAGYDDMAAQEGPSGGKEYGTAKPRRKSIDEAEYQGRKVQLGKPMKGDVKKFKVFVKNPKTGNVKKVNFGDKNMEIKRDDPKRRKNFRARHGCGTSKASDRTKARYWSCRMWSSKPVSKIVKEAEEKKWHQMSKDDQIAFNINRNREIDARVDQTNKENKRYWEDQKSKVTQCEIDINVILGSYLDRHFPDQDVYIKLDNGYFCIAKPQLVGSGDHEELKSLGYRRVIIRGGRENLKRINLTLKNVLENGFDLGGRYVLSEQPESDEYEIKFKTKYDSTVNPSGHDPKRIKAKAFTVVPMNYPLLKKR